MSTQEASGKPPTLDSMHLAPRQDWKARLLHESYSSGAPADPGRVSGCMAADVLEPARENFTGPDKRFLLGLARKTLTCTAADGNPPPVSAGDVPGKLAEARACFVTLTESGSLRGCMGTLQPRESLFREVINNVRNAATNDWRFPPVTAAEVDRIRIEISVLTEPQAVRFNSPEDLLGKLQPNEDGVVLKIGSSGATFLPQVWAQIPDKIEFLNQLSRKAGCEPSAWRGAEISVFTYRVESFEETA
jgi:AmmeMemoRadiSam system protein A